MDRKGGEPGKPDSYFCNWASTPSGEGLQIIT